MTKTNELNQVTRTGLYWPGKRTEVERIALPFQTVETVNVSRATRETAPLLASIQDDTDGAWRNKLIWGENKYIMASLLDQGFAGKINLIYIDPPFATGADFSVRMMLGDEEWTKEASVIEEKAYRDTWGKGIDSYLQMMYDRLVLMRDLLAGDGSIYVHCDWRVNSFIRNVLDEVLGSTFFLNELIWQRTGAHNDAGRFGVVHDSIFLYSKTHNYTFNPIFISLSDEHLQTRFNQTEEGTGRRFFAGPITAPGSGPARVFDGKQLSPPKGRHWSYSQEAIDELEIRGLVYYSNTGTPYLKQYMDEYAKQGRRVQSIWTDILPSKTGSEVLGYPTQKPGKLLERIIAASSNEGDLIADFFCGSGTTGAVAEKLGRRWIMADLSRFAIQVSSKRLLDIPGCRPFEIMNLGKYERQYWQVHVNGEGAQQHEVLIRYVDFIVQLYRGERVTGFTHLHGQKAGRMVHVGAVDAPVTLSEINEPLDECSANKFRGLDVLGWEWEMGLHDLVTAEARKRGVDLRLLTIPREVMDPRAVEAGDIDFYELAYLDVALDRTSSGFRVALKSFIIPNEDLVPEDVRKKIKRWSDYVDFWAVDWDYQGDTFHNQWQSYRTRQHPALQLESDWHTYDEPGTYQVMVKVIDIFGNDTTKLLEVDAR